MAFIPILNTVLLTALFQDGDGVQGVNRHYFATDGVPTAEDLSDIADMYTDWFTENYVATMNDWWTLESVITRAMNEEFGLEFVATTGVPQNGEVGSAPPPNQVSYTVTWLTGYVGRSFRGRTYAVGLNSVDLAAGHKALTDAARDGYQAKWAALAEGAATAGHAMQIVSLSEAGVPREEGVTTPVIGARVNLPLATQRRRLR